MDKTLQTLGLKRCGNTIVGNALLRGISGGEKKRLTTAEMTGAWLEVQCSTAWRQCHPSVLLAGCLTLLLDYS